MKKVLLIVLGLIVTIFVSAVTSYLILTNSVYLIQ